ncbi:hypothetical protein E4U58_001931 [Claviceps cyperi]|nr:hypothetical protein E4U58_001931 [Claviceps cyperi]
MVEAALSLVVEVELGQRRFTRQPIHSGQSRITTSQPGWTVSAHRPTYSTGVKEAMTRPGAKATLHATQGLRRHMLAIFDLSTALNHLIAFHSIVPNEKAEGSSKATMAIGIANEGEQLGCHQDNVNLACLLFPHTALVSE